MTASSLPRETVVEIEAGERVLSTFGDFLDANEDIDDGEADLIAVTLSMGMAYRGGGGAEGEWIVRVAP